MKHSPIGKKQTIIDIVGEDGPLARACREPQLMLHRHTGFSSFARNRQAMKDDQRERHRQRMKNQYGI